ncbi:hypothetical protein N7508_006608 [Penicillium antarcticum]|uniref:uncharacterized protein n=1 Tax=Penicillium antarcticum TaxID=416450 RepID=UPI00238BB7B6|nr:uncharacterized protein N7508_006608 [Penicillium antarcticum]KAJ5301745.1 hypothetical protein N7508_006608 [Penicillium antarcticum]
MAPVYNPLLAEAFPWGFALQVREDAGDEDSISATAQESCLGKISGRDRDVRPPRSKLAPEVGYCAEGDRRCDQHRRLECGGGGKGGAKKNEKT